MRVIALLRSVVQSTNRMTIRMMMRMTPMIRGMRIWGSNTISIISVGIVVFKRFTVDTLALFWIFSRVWTLILFLRTCVSKLKYTSGVICNSNTIKDIIFYITLWFFQRMTYPFESNCVLHLTKFCIIFAAQLWRIIVNAWSSLSWYILPFKDIIRCLRLSTDPSLRDMETIIFANGKKKIFGFK